MSTHQIQYKGMGEDTINIINNIILQLDSNSNDDKKGPSTIIGEITKE